jgi:hypothetical protein
MILHLQAIGQILLEFVRQNAGVTTVFLSVIGGIVWFSRTIISDI